MPERYGIIIGSGFDSLLQAPAEQFVETRFGAPSAPLQFGVMAGVDVVALPRHGKSHSIPPHAINYRANLVALANSGVTAVIALCTVGVISDVCAAGELAVPEQLLDYTWGREQTIYDGSDGVVEHIDFTRPFSCELRQELLRAAATTACHDGGVYAATQGPRLESAAEVDRLARDGADFVGMTAMPEAALARELGIAYACLALVVNPAAGRGSVPIHSDVERCTSTARAAALDLLQRFFAEAARSD